MSGNGKRVLPASAASTAALIPFTQGAYAGGASGTTNSNDNLIDQLVGGLVHTKPATAAESRFFNPNTDNSNQTRTYSIDDEEIDEPPVPIPSTWRSDTDKDEPNWWVEQLKASTYGFAIGLFVVIPAVMLLTGQAEQLPIWQSMRTYVQSADVGIGVGEPAPNTVTATTAQEVRASDDSQTAVAAVQPVSQEPSPSQAVERAAPPAVQAEQPRNEVVTSSLGETSSLAEAPTRSSPKIIIVRPRQQPLVSAAIAAPAPESVPTPATAPAYELATPPAAPPAAEADGLGAATVTAARTSETTTTIETTAPAARVAPPASSVREVARMPEATISRPGAAAPAPLSVERAQVMLKNGKVDEGRMVLAKLASKGSGPAIFALAESFDPNVLAAWGTEGAKADPEKAKMFYSMALKQGVANAEGRLNALE
ncbi:MAG: hypothetical protein ACR2PA_02375 [Hyphomicrobiaceae bacterium]